MHGVPGGVIRKRVRGTLAVPSDGFGCSLPGTGALVSDGLTVDIVTFPDS